MKTNPHFKNQTIDVSKLVPSTPAQKPSPANDDPQERDRKDGEEGEGGETAPAAVFTAFTPSNSAFLAAIFTQLPTGAQVAITGKAGDPQTGGWLARSLTEIDNACPPGRNNYFNCASLTSGEDGTIAARKESASAYHALVLDDVGTKVSRDLIAATPTWELETSPGNFQIGFKLNPPITDHAEVEQLQQTVAAAGLTDKGALGMVRWARLPDGINGKPKYHADSGKPFRCRLQAWRPEVSYSAQGLLDALSPKPVQPASPPVQAQLRRIPQPVRPSGIYTPAAAENPVLTALKTRNLYKRTISAGRHEVTCPWVSEHTDGLDTVSGVSANGTDLRL